MKYQVVITLNFCLSLLILGVTSATETDKTSIYNLSDPTGKRNLATTITSVTSCVTCIKNAAQKYCRNPTSTSATGYCCLSAETGDTCGGSQASACSNDDSKFPLTSEFNLCPISQSTSVCGLSPSKPLEIWNGFNPTIVAYSITSGEMCSYTIEVTDPKAKSFTVQLQTATNVNVVLAKRATSSSYTDAKALNPNEVVTITVKEGDVYRIAAVSTGAGVGKLALAVQSPITGSAKPEDDNSGGIVGIVLLGYFVFPWLVLFIVMFILYCVKKRKINRNRQQRKQHSGYQNQPPPPMMYNQNYSYNQNTYRNHGVKKFYGYLGIVFISQRIICIEICLKRSLGFILQQIN